MNNVILVGRTTKDAELKYLPNTGTAVARFTIAIDRDYKGADGKKITDFIICEAMGKTADFVATYITKGRLIGIHGTLRVDSYMEDDNRRTFTKIFVKNINALDSGKTKTDAAIDGFEAVYDDEIPF